MLRTTASFARAFHAARRVSTPLIAVRTPDPASAIQLILSTLKDDRPQIGKAGCHVGCDTLEPYIGSTLEVTNPGFIGLRE